MGASPRSGAAIRLWRALFLASLLATLAGALLPADRMPQTIVAWQDKAMHALAFALLAFIGWRSELARPLALFAGLVVFGLGIEVAQSFTATRQAEWLDLAADAAGAGIVLVMVQRVTKAR